jgi:hypothetical protein
MKRRSVTTAALFITVAWSLSAAADAPTSGPDQQYADFASADTSITDQWTKLVWDRTALKTFALASASCPAGLRVPTVKELLTLVDEAPHFDYDVNKLVQKNIDQRAFSNTPGSFPFWTSTPYQSNQHWTVDFTTGETGHTLDGDTRFVRCVRFGG